jgi:hypothetical protein
MVAGPRMAAAAQTSRSRNAPHTLDAPSPPLRGRAGEGGVAQVSMAGEALDPSLTGGSPVGSRHPALALPLTWQGYRIWLNALMR